MIYDIRTSELAKQTLVNLTGVSINIWEKYVAKERAFEYCDLVKSVIENHGVFPCDYKNWTFVYIHITTSANGCESFKNHGINDLRNSYLLLDSELRNFLDKNNIFIDIDNAKLIYNKKVYNINYGDCPIDDCSKEYKCWSIGRKLYFDYRTCGFLSVRYEHPYGGEVHCRPEILYDIDKLLDLSLSYKWKSMTIPYQIVAKVSGGNIVSSGSEDDDFREQVINYLTKAYLVAFSSPNDNILLLKNGIKIEPCDIIDIRKLDFWLR